MHDRIARRQFLGSAAAAVAEPLAFAQTPAEPPAREVRLEFLHPREIDAARTACPVIFQPLGTIEWHGLHNVVGVDAVKAHALCIRAARAGGGVVAPPLFGGVGGLDQPHTFIMDPEDNVFSRLLRPWLEQLCREMARDGYRAVIILTGHYGAAQQIVVRETAVRMSRALAIPVLGTPEYMLALDEDYVGDHAAWGETSLMMHLYPGSVDLSRLGAAPHQGVGGRDPKTDAKPEDGRRITDAIVSRLATLARNMPSWDFAKLDRFIAAEDALVTKQLSAPRGKGAVWTAWKNNAVALRDYGRLIADEKFDDIVAAVAKL